MIVWASYTANLAAYVTVSRMDNQIQSFGDVLNLDGIRTGTVAASDIFYLLTVKICEMNLFNRWNKF